MKTLYRFLIRSSFPVATAVSLVFPYTPISPDTLLLSAMRHEMRRSMDSLKLKNEPGPYFLSYMLWDIQGWRVEASLGSVEKAGPEPTRMLDVDLRVGSYARDQTLYAGGMVFGPSLRAPIPEGNDTLLLRQALWAMTDARYKVAVEQLAQKKSFIIGHQGLNPFPDWSRQKSLKQQQMDAVIPPDTAAWVPLCRKLSAAFAGKKWLADSRVAYQYYYLTFYYVDSDGSEYIQSLQEHSLLAALMCQAVDGAPLWEYLRMSARDSLPGPGKAGPTALLSLRDSLTTLLTRLDALRNSPPLDLYRGPVLFSGKAAGEIIRHALLYPQSALREPLSEYSEPAFLPGLLGRTYLPEEFSVLDNPNREFFEGHKLFGAYEFDHQGQPAEEIKIIEGGKLTDFYRGKLPLSAFEHRTNGHWRYGGGFPGVVEVKSSRGVPESQLLDSLRRFTRDEGADFGLRITKLADEDAWKLLRHPLARSVQLMDENGGRGTFGLPSPVSIDAVNLKTGKIYPVRGLTLRALDSKSLRNIAAAGNTPHLLEPQSSFSLLCPSLLFTLLDLGGSRQVQPRLPLLP